jgi:hypothetical protein
MAIGLAGLDSTSPAGSTILSQATSTFGAAPSFWGRYFHAPGQIDYAGVVDSTNYSATESQFLNSNGIRVLPIARQTRAVGTDQATGRAHAALNVQALFEAFAPSYLYGADPDVLMFLDVEQGTPLSQGYYSGWSDELVKQGSARSSGTVNLHPAIYMGQANTASAAALNAAVSSGSICAGVWIARYWNNTCAPPADWDDTLVTPNGGLPCPILAWQYADACGSFDCSQANPAHQDILISRLVLPPSNAVSV